MAAAAGVSVATVSRVLNSDAGSVQIRPETRQRVLETSEELGYRPNDLARALLQQRSSVIGLVIPDISNPYYPGLVRGVEDIASTAGYRIVLCNTDRATQKVNGYLDILVSSRVDGVIIAGGGTETVIDTRVLRQYQTKIVLVGRHGLPHPSVQIDNVAAAEQVTDHLLDLGHRRIAFITGPRSSYTVQDRFDGFNGALSARGVNLDSDLIFESGFDEESGYQGAHALVRHSQRPTAIVAANDRIALGVLASLSDDGVEVPAQMSVTGFDDVSFSSYLRPRLTTVSIPTYDMGACAAELLLDQLRGPSAEDSKDDALDNVVLLPTELVVRGSSGSCPSLSR